MESESDPTIRQLVDMIRDGIPDSRDLWPDGVVMYKKRIVIPKNLQREVLDVLHSAHQGCSSMEARA